MECLYCIYYIATKSNISLCDLNGRVVQKNYHCTLWKFNSKKINILNI